MIILDETKHIATDMTLLEKRDVLKHELRQALKKNATTPMTAWTRFLIRRDLLNALEQVDYWFERLTR